MYYYGLFTYNKTTGAFTELFAARNLSSAHAQFNYCTRNQIPASIVASKLPLSDKSLQVRIIKRNFAISRNHTPNILQVYF